MREGSVPVLMSPSMVARAVSRAREVDSQVLARRARDRQEGTSVHFRPLQRLVEDLHHGVEVSMARVLGCLAEVSFEATWPSFGIAGQYTDGSPGWGRYDYLIRGLEVDVKGMTKLPFRADFFFHRRLPDVALIAVVETTSDPQVPVVSRFVCGVGRRGLEGCPRIEKKSGQAYGVKMPPGGPARAASWILEWLSESGGK